MNNNTKSRRLNKKQKLALIIDADAYITNAEGAVWCEGGINPTTAKRMLSSGAFEIKNGLLTWNDGGLGWYVFTDTSLTVIAA